MGRSAESAAAAARVGATLKRAGGKEEPAPLESAAASRLPAAALVAVPLLLTAAFFYPILHNYFFGDDLLNLYRIVDWGFAKYVFTPYAGHVLVLRNAIYYACFALFGPDPSHFFQLVLLTHLLNVFLLFRVLATFTASARLACLGAALWGIAPINEGTLGWYSVYGQVLVATFLLALLWRLGRVARGETVAPLALGGWSLLVVAISTLFGTGIGVAMVMPVVALLVLPPSRSRRALLLALFAAALAVPVVYYGLHSLAHSQGWGTQGMALSRLLPAWRVLVEVFFGLLGRGAVSLFRGAADSGPSDPSVLSILILLAAILALGAYCGGRPVRRLLLACLALSGAGYFMIALGRGAMVAAGMDAEKIIAAARYHYLGPLPVALALCAALAAIGARWRAAAGTRDALLLGCLVVLLGLRFSTAAKIDSHRPQRLVTAAAVERLHAVIDAAPAGRDLYIRLPEKPFLGIGPMLMRKLALFPSWAGVFVVFFPDNVVDGKSVHFVTAHRGVLYGASGRRSASLFVAPRDLPDGQSAVDL